MPSGAAVCMKQSRVRAGASSASSLLGPTSGQGVAADFRGCRLPRELSVSAGVGGPGRRCVVFSSHVARVPGSLGFPEPHLC